MQDDQIVLDWLRLARVELPAAKLNALLDIFENDPKALLSAGSLAWAASGLNPAQIKRMEECATCDADKVLAPFHRCDAHIVTRRGAFSEHYPQALRDLPGAPPILHVRGRLLADDRFSIAIVGSRRATNYGLAIAEQFSRELCAHGLCIVSGGARGVDTRAHRGALAAGGRTVAFVGCGLDIPYPAENRALFDEMIASGQGAIVSEYPFGANPDPWRFPGRNRLIAGMSLGTLVIESDVTSGAMITASDAASAGRDVFAVPGSIESGRSSGCHRLIQEGAKLTQSSADILQEVGILQLTADPAEQFRVHKRSRLSPASSISQPAPAPLVSAPAASLNLPPDERSILELLTLECSHVDYLAETSGLSAATVVAALTMLEIKKLAKRVPGNAFVRVL